MADGKNNHTRKELDTKLDTNMMDDVEFRKWKLKEIHRRTLLPVFDPMWVEHTLGAEAAESLLSELKICVHQRRKPMLRQLGVLYEGLFVEDIGLP